MTDPATPPPADDRPLHDRDFYLWTVDQAAALRRTAPRGDPAVDWSNVAEEIESMGRSQLSAVQSWLARVIELLLKLEHSAAAHPRADWEDSVLVHRGAIRQMLDDSPGLRRKMDMDKAYTIARSCAARGLHRDGLDIGVLPQRCPYGIDQVLDLDWWPVNRHGLA
jgi:hypothetical protein